MESTAITFDQPPDMVGGLSEKLDRMLELLEKVGVANPFNQLKHKRRMVYAKEAYTIMKCPSRQDLRVNLIMPREQTQALSGFCS